jgi:signal transduction histidine kinase
LAGAACAGLAALACLMIALVAARRATRALTADRERLRVALDAMNEGILFYGPDERITLVNPRMAETFPELADLLVPGSHADDVIRRGFALGLYPGGDEEAYIARRREERRTPQIRRELALNDGRTILIRESVTPGGGRVLLYTDATQEKAADRAKADFVSTVSHELRTPLTSISGALALIGAGAAGELGPKARQLVDIAGRNAERLTRLVDDLLHVQRLEAPIDDIVAVPVPLEALLERAAAEIAPMALKRGVRIARAGAVPPEARVMGDEHRLIQVLHNLLSNAVKFSPAGERVDLTARPDGGMWRISVSDRGPGIPPAFRAQVFRRFAQADAGDTRARGGTGLGLSIAKAIVDKLDGRISFETEMGTGTTFTVELAAAEAEPARVRA